MISKINSKKKILGVVIFFLLSKLYAFTWQDVWFTPDQQAAKLMQQGEFSKAESLFQQPNWQAIAAYRAKDYQRAAQQFGLLDNEQGYYNQGNALANLSKYQEAINAYDKALSINPSNKDAQYNRQLVADLLKKQQKQQQQANNQAKDNKEQSKESNKNKNTQASNGQQNPKDKGQQQENKQTTAKEAQQKKEQKSKQKQQQQSKGTTAKNQSEKKQNKEGNNSQNTASISPQEQEKQQTKEQWLKLIPDDPGGLLREKFLRDYLRRQRGWNQ